MLCLSALSSNLFICKIIVAGKISLFKLQLPLTDLPTSRMSSSTHASISAAVPTVFYQTAMFLTALWLDHCQQEHSSVSAREQEMERSITSLKQLSCSPARHLPKEQGWLTAHSLKTQRLYFKANFCQIISIGKILFYHYKFSNYKIPIFPKRIHYLCMYFLKLFDMLVFWLNKRDPNGLHSNLSK